MHVLSHSFRIAFIVLCLILPGCNDGPARPKTTQVTGLLTYKGQPVREASVGFVPDVPAAEMSRHPGAFAITDNDGRFVLMTFKTGDGAIPGKYKITVSKQEAVTNTKVAETGADDYFDDGGGEYTAAPPKSVFPVKYSTPATSDLTVNVPEGDPIEYEFELKD